MFDDDTNDLKKNIYVQRGSTSGNQSLHLGGPEPYISYYQQMEKLKQGDGSDYPSKRPFLNWQTDPLKRSFIG